MLQYFYKPIKTAFKLRKRKNSVHVYILNYSYKKHILSCLHHSISFSDLPSAGFLLLTPGSLK